MAQLKGFYFSLDALTASMVLIAAVGMLATYTPQTEKGNTPFQLDYVEAAATQNLSDWNNSKENDQKVLTHIYEQHYSGNPSKADQACQNYFNFTKKYALYYSNTTDREKVCGTLSVQKDKGLATKQVLTRDKKINGNFLGPKTATMVVHN